MLYFFTVSEVVIAGITFCLLLMLFPNKCDANCVRVKFADCPGLNMVIPEKTTLPPNKDLALRLQNIDPDVQQSWGAVGVQMG